MLHPEASLKPLTRAHRTIQHFSKNTPPNTRLIIHYPPPSRPVRQNDPGWLAWFCIGSVVPHIPKGIQETPARPRTVSQPPNRTVLFNIASILCLSMLFSKNSEVSSPKAFEKNTSSTPHNTVPVSPGFSMITHLKSTRVSSGGAI